MPDMLHVNTICDYKPHSPVFTVGAKYVHGKTVPTLYPADLLNRPESPDDNLVTFEKTDSPNKFTMHVVGGNPGEVAQCLDIQA